MGSTDIGMVFGAQYYRPPFPGREAWRRDLAHMRELGFNTVKLWAVWNWTERSPGVFTFDDLDELMDIAHENGLRVVVNAIPEGAPYWMAEGNGDAFYTTAKGERVAWGGPANLPSAGWPGCCPDHEEAAAAIARFIGALAAHIGGHPAMLALDVWNEPHLEPMFDYRGDMLCYCRHSRERFRTWLKEKYGTLDRLNSAWFRAYTSWEQADPPPRIGTWADMMDWRLFWLDNLGRWMQGRIAAARSGYPGIRVQSHVAYSGYLGTQGNGGLANELGDEFILAREVDVFGLTCFPKWLMRRDPFFNHLLNSLSVAEASRGKPFYQVELQGGGGKAGLLGGEVPDEADIRLWNYITVAAGGKGVTYWQYAPEPAGIESPGFGLTGFLGEDTPRSLEAGRCARALDVPMLALARPVKPLNAVYLSRTNSVWFYSADRQEAMYAQSVHGFCKAAYLRGIPFGFVHQDHLDTAWDEGVRVLMLPMPMVLSAKEIEALEAFIRAGGTVVSEAFPGLYDGAGLLDQQASALRRLFGLAHVEVQGLPEGGKAEATAEGTPVFRGALYRHAVQPLDGVAVKASFADGLPAWTEYSQGQGKGVWLGSFVSIPYAKGEAPENEEVLAHALRREGYGCFASLDVPRGEGFMPALATVVRLLRTDSTLIAVTVNTTGREAPVRITLDGAAPGSGEIRLTVPPQSGMVTPLAAGGIVD
ncbi:MAG TPA: alpha-amylase family protein [Candidatus Limnocylindria bacterium]|nr:alpha-amylase family protein [Candidatus Limnocylindria bacterium]